MHGHRSRSRTRKEVRTMDDNEMELEYPCIYCEHWQCEPSMYPCNQCKDYDKFKAEEV